MDETDNEVAFTYNEGTGKGPKKWGLINKKWEACNNGKMQSPINILKDEVEVLPSLGKLKRDYKAAPATVQNRGHDITVSTFNFFQYFVNFEEKTFFNINLMNMFGR